jgi:ferrous iron transport protein A
MASIPRSVELAQANVPKAQAHAKAADCRAQTCPLGGLGVGSCGRVLSVSGEPESRRRLLEMGFCNGALVEFVRRAPFGDPLEFKLRGYCLCLREDQANCITVAPDKV